MWNQNKRSWKQDNWEFAGNEEWQGKSHMVVMYK